MRFIDFFSKIYIINLPERKDRFKHITNELKRVDMPLDSNKIEVFSAIRPETKEPFHNIGCKGCFLSHLTLLKKARDLQLGNILILEDDARFLPIFLNNETHIIDNLTQSTWDIVQFGYFPSSTDPQSQSLTIEKTNTPASLVSFSGEVTGTPCVAANGKSLNKIIEFLEILMSRPLGDPEGGPMPIDGAYNIFSRTPSASRLLISPPIVGQASSRSDISPKWHDKHLVLQPVISGLRKLGLSSLMRKS